MKPQIDPGLIGQSVEALQQVVMIERDLNKQLRQKLREVRGYLEEIRNGRVTGTSEQGAGERAKRYAHQIIREIEADNWILGDSLLDHEVGGRDGVD